MIPVTVFNAFSKSVCISEQSDDPLRAAIDVAPCAISLPPGVPVDSHTVAVDHPRFHIDFFLGNYATLYGKGFTVFNPTPLDMLSRHVAQE